jgi:hypothetical protein
MDTLEQNTMRMHAPSCPTRSKRLKSHASPRRALVLVSMYGLSLCCFAGYLSFHPMAQCVVHALKGLACRAPVLLTHAEVTEYTIFFQWVQNLGTRWWCTMLRWWLVACAGVAVRSCLDLLFEAGRCAIPSGGSPQVSQLYFSWLLF